MENLSQQALKCGVCHRIYKSRNALTRHMHKHEKSAAFTCSDCGKTFPTNTRLNIHSRVHSGKRPFKCSYCPVYFASSFQLKLHHRRHTGEKPYICSYCQKSFSSSSGLQQHVKTHTNQSPFSCSQCNRSFKQREKLKQHERIHSGDRPYMCDRCPSTFRVKNSLVRHLRIHSGEMFKCKLCPKEFGELYSLKKHHRKQHDKLQFTNPGKKSVLEDHSLLFAIDSSVAKYIRGNPAKIKKNIPKNKKQQQVKRSWRKNKHTSDVELNKVVAENLHLEIGLGDMTAVVDEYGWHRIPLSVGGDLLNRNMKLACRELLNRNTETPNRNMKKITAVLNTRKQHDDLILVQGQRSCVKEEQQFEQKGCIAADMCQHQTVSVSNLDREGQPTCNTGSSRRREASRPSTIEYFPITDQSSRCEYMGNIKCSQFLMSPMCAYTSDSYVQDPGCVPRDGEGPEQRSHANNFVDCPVVSPRFYTRLCHQNLQQTEVDKHLTSNPGSFYQSQQLGQLGGQHQHHTATLHHHSDAHENGDLPAYLSTHQPCNCLQETQIPCPASSWPTTQQFRSLEATAYGKNPSHIQHHLPGNYQQTLDLTQLQTSTGLSSVVSSELSVPKSFVEKTNQYLLCHVECKQQVPSHRDGVQSNQQSVSQVESVNSQLYFSNVQCSIKSINPLLHEDELLPSNQQQHTSAIPDQPPESNNEPFTCNLCLKTGSLALPDRSTCQVASNVGSLGNSVETFCHLKSSVVHHKPSCVVPPDWSGEACSDNCWQTNPHMQQLSSNFHHYHLRATVSDNVHHISTNMSAFSGQPDCLARGQLVRAVTDNLGVPQTTSDANKINKGHSTNIYLAHELVQPLASCTSDHSLLAHIPIPGHMIPSHRQHNQAAVLHLKDCSHSQKVCSDGQKTSSITQEVCSGVEDCSDIHKSTQESRNVRTSIHLQDELCQFPERVVGIHKESLIFPHSRELHNLGEPWVSHVCKLASAGKDLGNGSIAPSVGVPCRIHLCGEHNVDVSGKTHFCGEHNLDVSGKTHLCGEHNVDVPGKTHLCGEHNVDVPGKTHLCGEHNVDVPGKTHLCSEHNVDIPGRYIFVKSTLNYARLREGGGYSPAALEACRRKGVKEISENRSLNLSQHTISSGPLSQTQGDVSCSHSLEEQVSQVQRANSTGEPEHTEGTNKDNIYTDTLKDQLASVRRRNINSTNTLEGKKCCKSVANFDESNFDSCQPLGVISVTVAAGSQTTAGKESNLKLIQEHGPINSDKNGVPQCGKEDREAREKHKLRRQVDKVKHKCDTCGKQFPHRSHLQRHIKIHAPEKPYPCHLCSQGFTAQKYLHNHIRRHNKQPAIFSCQICGKIFGRKYQLKIHARTHSGEKPYKCSQCSCHFATSFQVQLHRRVHSDLRPYKCQHCSKCFRSHTNLALHVKRHNNDRPYLCATCGATFYEASKLTAHIRVHTGVHPFICDQCPKTFKVKHLLVRHLRWHSGDTFNCEHCNKQFDEQWTLRAHVDRRHSKTSVTL